MTFSSSTDTCLHNPPPPGAWPTLAIGSIAIDKTTDPATIYVGTGEPNYQNDGYWGVGILKSTDGGQSWTWYGYCHFAGFSIGKIAIDPLNSQIVLAAAVPPVPGQSSGGAPPPVAPPVTLTNGGIWRSTDGGHTWAQVLAGTNESVADGTDVVFDAAGNAYAGLGDAGNSTADNTGVYKSASSDSGSTWTPLTNVGLPSSVQIGRVSIAVSPDANGTDVYVLVANKDSTLTYDPGNSLYGGVYVSTTSGTSFTRITTLPPQMVSDAPVIPQQWTYEAAIAVDPLDPSIVYVGGSDLWVGIQYGQDWSGGLIHQEGFPFHTDQHAITFLPNSSTFYLGNDGGIWSADASPSPTSITNLNGGGLDLTQFYSGSIGLNGTDAQLYGGAQDNGELQYPYSAPLSGLEWNEVDSGDGFDTSVDSTNNQIVYDEYGFGAMKKSTNGGQPNSWNSITGTLGQSGSLNACDQKHNSQCDATNFDMPFIMSPNNHLELIAGTGHLYKTTDGGSTWSPISPAGLDTTSCNQLSGCPVSAIAVAPNNDNYIYSGDNNGYIFATSNGGTNWYSIGGGTTGATICDSHENCSTGGIVTGLAVDPTNASTVCATFADFAQACNAQATTCGHLFKSTDAGKTWTDLSLNSTLPNAPFESVLVNPNDDTHVFVGTDVGVFISTDSGATWSQLGTNLPNVAIDQIFTDPTGEYLYVATHGRGMWTTILDPNVYAGTGGPELVSLTETGSRRWTYTSAIVNQNTPALDNGIVFTYDYANNSWVLIALDSKTGAILWSRPTAMSGGGAFVNGTIYGSETDSHGQAEMVALNESTGAVLWTYDTQDQTYLLGPTVYNGVAYYNSHDGYVYALSASSGTLLWKSPQLCFTCTVGLKYAPAVDGTQVYVVEGDENSLIELNAATGQEGWYDFGYEYPYIATYSAPVAANGLVYFTGGTQTGGDEVVAVSAQTGYLAWAYQVGSAGFATSTMPWVAGGLVFVGTADGNIYAIANGTKVWSYTTGGMAGNPVVADGIVYVGSQDGYLYALRVSTGSLLWKYNMGAYSNPTSRPAVGE